MDIIAALTDQGILNKAEADTLKEVFGDEYASIMQDFISLLPKHISDLKIASKEKHDENIYHISHTLKGMAGNLGCTEFAYCCQKIEESARKHTIGDYDHVLDDINQLANKFIEISGAK